MKHEAQSVKQWLITDGDLTLMQLVKYSLYTDVIMTLL